MLVTHFLTQTQNARQDAVRSGDACGIKVAATDFDVDSGGAK